MESKIVIIVQIESIQTYNIVIQDGIILLSLYETHIFTKQKRRLAPVVGFFFFKKEEEDVPV